MSVASPIGKRKKVETGVSSFDVLNSALIASILLFGFLVVVMFLIWLTTAFDFSGKKSVKLIEIQEPFGDEKPEGFEDDIMEPGVEEFPEVETPQLKDALEAVTDAVSSVKASLEKRDGDAAEMGKGAGFGSRTGGEGRGNANVLPEWKRWQINYESKNIGEYAAQLDGLNLTLGAISTENDDIALVNNVSRGPTATVSNRTKMGKTLRFEHKKVRLRRWDQKLCKDAGVDLRGRITCQFYPSSTRQMLRLAEATYLQSTDKQLEDVRRTFFKVIKSGGGYDFQVTDILFKN